LTGRVARGDQSILHLGFYLYKKLGAGRAADIRHRMRLLARLKMNLNEKCLPHVDATRDWPCQADDYIRPELFDHVCSSIQAVAMVSGKKTHHGINMLEKPGIALKIVGE
jgi:hypothetical protein